MTRETFTAELEKRNAEVASARALLSNADRMRYPRGVFRALRSLDAAVNARRRLIALARVEGVAKEDA